MNPQAFVFFGRSGCGKGTQAELLAEYLNKKGESVLHVETGKAFRRLEQEDNVLGKNVRSILENGGLIPVFLPIWVWTDYLMKNFTGQEHIILDGVCRRKEEAVALDSAFDFYGIKNPNIILMNVSEKWSNEKMMGRKREDDTPEKIKSRLDWYEKDVLPSLQYFREKAGYDFIEINGEQTIEEVHQDIIKALGI